MVELVALPSKLNPKMILIGTMNLTRTRDRGDFYCPTCSASQAYRLRTRRPFLTLYFIPTVPIGGSETFVNCDGCRSNWDVTVLEMDRASHEQVQEDQFRDEAIRSAVLMTLIDDTITEQEIESLQSLSDTLFDRPLDREELGRLSSIARQSGIQASNYVMSVSKRWTRPQRMLALQGMFLAATASGEDLSPKKMQTLKVMRDLLELTNEEFQIAIDDSLEYEAV
ncbi:zinc-ribbon domain-containing protein [Allorhodopirellula solitaria]|uniref:Tellurite resistance protein TerB n=1 Tax=Allorhodopirellula solitaria TaxID=2527987 RepID=A0A5C5XPQ8_9BACT|nr:zinc ribbon domain-containing protein [Allorhodopirellula solitaria]TWT65157.1 Tellurite resistance protein TerB [Allorhodopirellula solitaria]